RFVDVLHNVLVGAAISNERKKEQPEHVEGSHSCGDEANNPQQEKAVESLAENFIFAEKSGEGKNPRDGQRRDPKRSRGNRNLLPQAAHLANVLIAGHRVDHAARPKEQQRFEESMSHQVKDSGGEGAHTQGEEHVSELADGGVGENLLNVVLHERHGGCKNGGNRTDYGDDVQGERRKLVNG